MSPRLCGRILAVYAILLVSGCSGLYLYMKESPPAAARLVRSRWLNGKLSERVVLPADTPPVAGTIDEVVIGEGPLWKSDPFFALGLVPGKDGIRAELDGKTAWLTVDDLLSARAYDHGASFTELQLTLGVSRPIVMHLIAVGLGVSEEEVARRATLRRVRFARRIPNAPMVPRITGDNLDRAVVYEAMGEAARYLARGVTPEGRFRYLIDAIENMDLGGYSWPRHAGATYFLAQAAPLLGDNEVRTSALRAANLMRTQLMQDCGEKQCIAEASQADVGSSALGIIAFAELCKSGIDPSFKSAVISLASFLKSQQRPDGEFMHLYDRAAKKPLDVQLLYYTGEAALALARAHELTHDPSDLLAAGKALDRLSGSGWTFFGSRYYFSEEHWTCQAVAELWDRAPNNSAADFCLRWHGYQQAIQQRDGDSPFEADGAFNVGPIITPRITPVSSRGEAAAAALDFARKRGDGISTVAALDRELRSALGFVLRNQFRPGPTHLFANPNALRGAIPGSPVDWQIRIDYAQHAGSLMIRYLELTAPPAKGS